MTREEIDAAMQRQLDHFKAKMVKLMEGGATEAEAGVGILVLEVAAIRIELAALSRLVLR